MYLPVHFIFGGLILWEHLLHFLEVWFNVNSQKFCKILPDVIQNLCIPSRYSFPIPLVILKSSVIMATIWLNSSTDPLTRIKGDPDFPSFNIFTYQANIHSYNTRSSSIGNLSVEYSRLNLQSKSFSRYGVRIWNSLSSEVHNLLKHKFKVKLHNRTILIYWNTIVRLKTKSSSFHVKLVTF